MKSIFRLKFTKEDSFLMSVGNPLKIRTPWEANVFLAASVSTFGIMKREPFPRVSLP